MPSEMPKVRFVEIHGRRIAYRDMGDRAGRPVILIHGFAGNSTSWTAVGARLASAGFRAIAFDLPGHGRSDRAAHYSLTLMEDDLASALDQLHLDPFDLIGHSLGGHLALRLAARMPHQVRRLVVEAAPVPPRDEEDAEVLFRDGPRPSMLRSAKTLGFGRLVRLVLFRRFDFRSAKPILAELKRPMPAWWIRLQKITHPCLLLTGSNDGLITSRASLMSGSLQDARLQIIGAGHHLHANHQNAFLTAVLQFLDLSEQGIAHPLNGVGQGYYCCDT